MSNLEQLYIEQKKLLDEQVKLQVKLDAIKNSINEKKMIMQRETNLSTGKSICEITVQMECDDFDYTAVFDVLRSEVNNLVEYTKKISEELHEYKEIKNGKLIYDEITKLRNTYEKNGCKCIKSHIEENLYYNIEYQVAMLTNE